MTESTMLLKNGLNSFTFPQDGFLILLKCGRRLNKKRQGLQA